MPKAKPVKKSKKDSLAQEVGSITFSTRFTEEQRDRIVAAAEIRGWTPSNLMRVSTLERSAHILNTKKETRVDFAGIAAMVATQLMNPDITPGNGRTSQELDDANDAVDMHGLEAVSLRMEQVHVLKNAARLAGGELLNMIIEACERQLAPDRKDLPEPIEPV